jgi:AraC family transcriptional regulator, ethanolamine operon transcriptional activator
VLSEVLEGEAMGRGRSGLPHVSHAALVAATQRCLETAENVRYRSRNCAAILA